MLLRPEGPSSQPAYIVFPSRIPPPRPAPALGTYPLLPKCTVGLQTIYHLFVLRPLWYSSPSVLMTPSLNFTPVKIWFPPDPVSSVCLNLKMSLMSYALLVPSFFFFSFFFFHLFHHVSLMLYIRAVPLNTRNYKLPTKNGSNRHSNHPLWQQDGQCSDTHECERHWPAQSIYHLLLVLWWGVSRSAPCFFVCLCVCLIVCLIVWILLCFCLSSYIPLKCLKKKKSGKAAQATEERWAVFKMDRNWTLSLIMFFTLHSSSSCYHCNNSPLAGTLCRLCVLWVMCCNPKWRLSRKK